MVTDFRNVCITGQRDPSSDLAEMARQIIVSISDLAEITVGDSRGIDSLARDRARQIFYAASYGTGRQAFARRSIAMIRYVFSLESHAVFAFTHDRCPHAVFPSTSQSRCFCGGGSGTWATAAYAAGLGIPVYIFGIEEERLPVWSLWVGWERVEYMGHVGYRYAESSCVIL